MREPLKRKYRYLDPETLQRIRPLELVAREVVEGVRVGIHKSPLRGFSAEFAHHRPYTPGDTPRHIDWRVYGRTQRYYVKMYEAETNFTANLLLDASRSMRFASGKVSKLEYAKYMAAALAYLVVEQRDSAGVAVFDSKLRRYIEPKGSENVVRHIAEALEETEAEERTRIGPLLDDFARRIPRRGFVMLFSDLFDHVDEFLSGLSHLRFRGHNVVVFHLLDPQELHFNFDGTWRFEGLEFEGALTTQPRRVRQAYLEEMTAFLQKVQDACRKSHVDYVLVDTSRPVDVVLSEYLIGRIRSAPGTTMR